MFPETKCSHTKCSPPKNAPWKKNALQSNPLINLSQPNLINAQDLPTLINRFEAILQIYLSSTLSTHEFFLRSIFFQGAFFLGSILMESILTGSNFWRAFDREHFFMEHLDLHPLLPWHNGLKMEKKCKEKFKPISSLSARLLHSKINIISIWYFSLWHKQRICTQLSLFWDYTSLLRHGSFLIRPIMKGHENFSP